MKNNKMKKMMLTVLSIVCALCLSLGIVGCKPTQEKPPVITSEDNLVSVSELAESSDSIAVDESMELTSFRIYPSASIKKDSPFGIRFEAGLTLTDKEKLPENAEFGFILAYSSDVTEQLTFETSKKVVVKATNWLKDSEIKVSGAEVAYWVSLVGGSASAKADMETAYYGTSFTARGYVKYTVDDAEKVVYTNLSVSSSLAGLAEYAKNNGDNTDFIAGILENTPKVQLIFDTQGGSTIETRELVTGSILLGKDKPADPTKEDYDFAGWYKDAACTDGQEFEFSGALTVDTTIYAKWVEHVDPVTMYTLSANVISVDPTYADSASYVAVDGEVEGREGVYKLTKNFDRMDQGFLFDVEQMGDLYEEGNVIVMDIFTSIPSWICVLGEEGSNNFAPYDEFFQPISGNGKNPTGQWCKMVAYIGLMEGEDANWGHGFGLSHSTYNDNNPLYISGITLYSSDKFEEIREEQLAEPQSFGANVISVDSAYADKATYVAGNMSTDFPEYAKEGVYKLNKYFDVMDQGFNFDVEALGSMYKAGNIIVIDMFVPCATWVAVKGLQGEQIYIPYGEDGVPVGGNNKTVVGWNKLVATIGDVVDGEGANWGHGFGLSHDRFEGQLSSAGNPLNVYVAGITIYSPLAFKNYCDEQIAKYNTKITKSSDVITAIAPNVDGFAKVDNFTGPAYDGDVYEFSNIGRGNFNYRQILQIDKAKFGKIFAVGNYILIDVYSNANLTVVTSDGAVVDTTKPKLTSGGTSAGGTYTSAYKQYRKVGDKYVEYSVDLNTGDGWSVMAIKITDVVADALIGFYAGPEKGQGGVYFGNVTVCNADYFESIVQLPAVTKSGSAIASNNAGVDPYTKVENFEGPAYSGDVYEFKNGGRGNYNHRKILTINTSLFGDLFAVDNYVLIDVYSNADLTVVTSTGAAVDPAEPKLTAGGSNSGGSYTGEYKQYKLVDGKYVYQSVDLDTGDSWSVMVLKITDVSNDMNINFYAGPAQGAEGVYFGNVTVCTAAYFEALLAE